MNSIRVTGDLAKVGGTIADENGEPIYGVQKVVIVLEPDRPPRAYVTFLNVSLDITAKEVSKK